MRTALLIPKGFFLFKKGLKMNYKQYRANRVKLLENIAIIRKSSLYSNDWKEKQIAKLHEKILENDREWSKRNERKT